MPEIFLKEVSTLDGGQTYLGCFHYSKFLMTALKNDINVMTKIMELKVLQIVLYIGLS